MIGIGFITGYNLYGQLKLRYDALLAIAVVHGEIRGIIELIIGLWTIEVNYT